VAPIVLMDVGDNVGGGSAGDSAVLLAEVMKQKGTNALVVLYDPASVRDCIATGVKGSVVLSVGGKTDQRHGQPIQITGRVRLISDGIFIENQVRHGGWSLNDQGVTVVLETEHQHTVILTSHRMPPLSLEQLLSLGVKPEQKRILIVKGVVAPRAAYEPIAAGIILVDSPGATSADLLGFEYRHRRRPLYPLELEAVYCA
jgi:microcystin degradation protein MlrC